MKHLFAALFSLVSTTNLAANINYSLAPETLELYRVRLGLSLEELQAPRDEQLLTKLIQRHLVAIPFENLEMHLTPARPISIDSDVVAQKLFSGKWGKNRGGYCYELNELFFRLLTSLGFDVVRVKASVWAGKEAGFIPHPSHQFSVVTIEGDRYLADVAFGLFTLFHTVKLPTERDQEICLGKAKFKRTLFDDSFGPEQQSREGFIYERQSERSQRYERISTFTLEAYQPKDYVSHNTYVQTQYAPFLENIFFTRFTEEGSLVARVGKRDNFSDIEAILLWIESAHNDGFAFNIK